MKVLVIGGGGREHALARKIAQSELVDQVFCAPGNAGTQVIGEKVVNVFIKADDIPGLLRLARTNSIDLAIVGPEDPLAAGIVDRFEDAGLKIFGPSQGASRLESSKVFTRELLRDNNIPTVAWFEVFTSPDDAEAFIKENGLPIEPVVIKADGLALGKGAIVCKTWKDVMEALDRFRMREFGEAGRKFLVEERLKGEEASYICFVDRNGNVLPLASSQDHKAVWNDDKGLNTGGMGAYSPAPVVDEEVEKRVLQRIVHPTIKAMKAEGAPFTGVLYVGLMIDRDGNPFVVEFNVRMGDPETQPIIARMKSDIVPIVMAAIDGKLDEVSIDWDTRAAVTVVMASGGYPGSYAKGYEISGIAEARALGVTIDLAGAALKQGVGIVTSGGRVLAVTALADTIEDTIRKAYEAVRLIDWKGVHFRDDIGDKALRHL